MLNRWCFSNGTDICVFVDSWLAVDDSFFVQSDPLDRLEDMRVNELFTGDGLAWGKAFIDGILAPIDVSQILKIPVAWQKPIDCLLQLLASSMNFYTYCHSCG